MTSKLNRREFVHSTATAALASTFLHPAAALAEPDTITVAAVGDCMITRPLSVLPPDEFLPLAKIIRAADVSFGNFEMTLADADAPPAYHDSCAYVHLRADSAENRAIAEELKWAGFKLLGLANNHSMDYGSEGLLATQRKLDDAGLAHAGTGRDLAEARSPVYFDSPRGRVALVACASTFPYGAFAADGNGEVPGRAGLSPVRVQTTYRVEPAQLDALRKVASSIGLGGGNANASSDSFNFLQHKFVAGSPAGVLTEADPLDTAAIAAAVKRASRNSELVLLGIHAHESAGRAAEIPAQFLQPFARACVDAGANAFIGHGPHVLRGIEIYKGCPIFYSLGNFFFHGESAKQIPPEIYATCGVSGTDPSDVFDKMIGGFAAEPFWISVIAVPTFRDRKLAALKLYPVTLQSQLSRSRRGTPMLATGTLAQHIIEELARLSQPYGTRIAFRDGVGLVEI